MTKTATYIIRFSSSEFCFQRNYKCAISLLGESIMVYSVASRISFPIENYNANRWSQRRNNFHNHAFLTWLS